MKKCVIVHSIALVFIAIQLFAQDNRNVILIENPTDRGERKSTLIIGNGDYSEAPLANPEKDARDIGQALTKLNFEVKLFINANREQMINAIRAFGQQLQDSGVGLFYFAGHGMQVNGKNYLIPVGTNIHKEYEVEYEAVNLGRVLGEMTDAKNRLNIVILDACRNNPYERSFRSASRGLASIDAPSGTIIAYATAPGSVAADGMKRNSPYTEALLTHIRVPGLSIEQVFKQVRIQVMKETNDIQVPWESTSLIGDFYFNLSQSDDTKKGISTQDMNFELAKSNYEKGEYDDAINRLKYYLITYPDDYLALEYLGHSYNKKD